MRRALKTIIVIFFICFIIATFNLPSILLNFLLVGAIPGTSLSIPPLAMLVLQLSAIMFISLEILAKRSRYFQQIRSLVFSFVVRNVRQSFRVFKRA